MLVAFVVFTVVAHGLEPTVGSPPVRVVLGLVAMVTVLAEWLTSRLASPNWLATGGAFVVAGVVVFGSLVGYYWWRADSTPAG